MLAGVFILCAAALPFLIDPEAVRENLARRLSAWSGVPVTISGPFRVTSFTTLTVEASGVRLKAGPQLALLSRAEAPSLKAVIKLSSLLRGAIEFKSVTVYAPRFVLRRSSGEPAPRFPGLGTVATALALSAKNPFSEIEFIEPVFFVADGARKPFRRAEAERIKLGMTAPVSQSPALLSFSVKSAGIDATFRGECDPAGLTAHGALRLAAALDSAKAKAMLTAMAPWENESRIAVTGDINWSSERVALEKATVAFGGHSASGSVALYLSSRRPLLEGTLAYDTLDLTAAWAAKAEALGKADAPPLAALPFASRGADRAIDLDMRVSADRFRAGSFETGPLALALTATRDRLSVDVAEVALFGGKASARLDVAPAQPVALSLRGSGSQFDPRALAEALQLPSGVSGPVSVQFGLTMPVTANAPLQDVKAAAGSFSARFPSGGTLEGDMARTLSAALAERDLDWGFGGASMPFAAATIDGTFRQGGIDLKIDGESGDKNIGGWLRIAIPGAAVSGALSARRSVLTSAVSPVETEAEADPASATQLVLSGTAEAVIVSTLAKPGVPN